MSVSQKCNWNREDFEIVDVYKNLSGHHRSPMSWHKCLEEIALGIEVSMDELRVGNSSIIKYPGGYVEGVWNVYKPFDGEMFPTRPIAKIFGDLSEQFRQGLVQSIDTVYHS